MTRASERFWKYEGTANDFLLVEAGSAVADLEPEIVAELCDRHRGVGGDGVLLVVPPLAPGAHARMIVRNADGSRPEMCGNGLRCVALHLAARDGVRAFTVETDAGPRACEVELDPRAALAGWVRVDMGVVQVLSDVRVEHAGRAYDLVAADAGNPHAIAFEALTESELDALGARLQHGEPFPRGVNLERVTLERDDAGPLARVDVFERGVGRTLACGTGACAVAAALVARGRVPRDGEVRVRLPGGVLSIAISAEGRALMRGPARRVFDGSVTATRPLVRELARHLSGRSRP